jgi:hypothetical protein
MERPDIGKPALGPGTQMRLVARTQSIEEANRIAEQYESEGYETQVMKKRQGILAIYEVWAGKSETRA